MNEPAAGATPSDRVPDELLDLLTTLSRALVDDPDSVDVRVVAGRSMSVFEIRVAKTDVGKLIGKDGRTLRSLRTIITAVGSKLQRKALVEIIE